MFDSDWLPSLQCIRIWSRESRVLPRRVGKDMEPKADSRIGNTCLKIWSRGPKAESTY